MTHEQEQIERLNRALRQVGLLADVMTLKAVAKMAPDAKKVVIELALALGLLDRE